MKVLIIDGNTEDGNNAAQKLGMTPYCETYAKIMEDLNDEVKTEIVHPSEIDAHSHQGHNSWFYHHNINEYDSFVWTGSPLNLYNHCEQIDNQRAFGEKVLKTGKPVFGSCWGLQINSELLGGKVRKNPKGREIGIARNIMLTESGIKHPLYANKPKSFNALAIHLDEVEQIPQGAKILAENEYSAVQAMAYHKNGVDFLGVQYHPEFDFKIMAFIYQRIGQTLITEGLCHDMDEVNLLIQDYKDMHEIQLNLGQIDRRDLLFRYGLTQCVLNRVCHRTELSNWIAYCKTKRSS